MNFWFIRQPCFIILSLFPQNISILTKSNKSSAEVAKNDLGTKNKNTSQESDHNVVTSPAQAARASPSLMS